MCRGHPIAKIEKSFANLVISSHLYTTETPFADKIKAIDS